MKRCSSRIVLLLAGQFLLLAGNSFAQQPVKEFHAGDFSADQYRIIRNSMGRGKTIPLQYEKAILVALSYFPELNNTPVHFRVKKVHTPLSSRPSWFSVLQINTKRIYIITISDSTSSFLTPILLQKMDFNAQVGVIGHELSHITDFNSRKPAGLIRIGLGNLSQRFLDRFEYRTDSICIAHGLGYQLLAWSKFVRSALHHENWDGAGNINSAMQKERYMNPETIIKKMKMISLYQQ